VIQPHYPNLRQPTQPRNVRPQVRQPVVSRPQPESLRSVRTNLEQWIADHPALCVGIALIAGVSLGWLIKRK
jgi:hypothetical protein